MGNLSAKFSELSLKERGRTEEEPKTDEELIHDARERFIDFVGYKAATRLVIPETPEEFKQFMVGFGIGRSPFTSVLFHGDKRGCKDYESGVILGVERADMWDDRKETELYLGILRTLTKIPSLFSEEEVRAFAIGRECSAGEYRNTDAYTKCKENRICYIVARTIARHQENEEDRNQEAATEARQQTPPPGYASAEDEQDSEVETSVAAPV